MIREVRDAVLACLVTFVICVVVYPAFVYGVGHTIFPKQAEGSLVEVQGKIIGSEIIAQPFVSDGYFRPRPSAVDYKADAAGGSNLATTNPDQKAKIAERAKSLMATMENSAPLDLVTASGSGLDPHISPDAALFQAERIAKTRRVPIDRIRSLIENHTDRSGLIVGALPRVNVLLLNLELDQAIPITDH